MKFKNLFALINLGRTSIVWKNALFFLFLITVSIAITGLLIFRFSADKIVNVSRQQQYHTSALVSNTFNQFVNNVTRDVRFLSQNPIVNEYIRLYPSESCLSYERQLADEFIALLYSKREYAQIRLISDDGGGKEIIRADNIAGAPTFIEKNDLQFKGDREYYTATKLLSPGEIYYSEIDLNKERGTLAYPLVPTFRIAAPLYTGDKFFGIVIINVDLSMLFNTLRQFSGEDYDLFLVNNRKQILLHPTDSLSFGFELDKEDQLSNYVDTTEVFKKRGLFRLKNKAFIVDSLEYGNSKYAIYSMVVSDEDIFLSGFNQWKWQILAITVIVILGFLSIAVYFIKRQALQLSTITNALTHFPLNLQSVPAIEIHRQDEIGRLALALQQMAKQVYEHVQELNTARNEAEQANRLKEEFLENMSHEIRNPLQSILGVVRLLQLNQPRPDQSAMIDTLNYSADTLHSLVNDVLDYKQLQMGKIELIPKVEYIGEKMAMMLKSHQYSASMRKVQLELDIDQELNKQAVSLDWLRLGQIVNNLINNAIKFSPHGSQVILRVRKAEWQGANGLTFTVQDNGPGIPESIINRISERYYRGADKGNIVGTGIGLNIVIGLLDLFKSKLHIESKPGQGSAFSFFIPCENFLEYNKTSGRANHSSMLVRLVRNAAAIDDDKLVLHWLQNVFTNAGITIQLYSSVEEFLSENQAVELLITDLHLEEGLSIEKLLALKAKLDSQEALLVYLSGAPPKAGTPQADLVFIKPVKAEHLLEQIYQRVITKKYGVPNLNSLFQDYDYDAMMIKNALDILIAEWSQIQESISLAIEWRDIDAFDKIFHKLIASLKRFEINKFEEKLQWWRNNYQSLADEANVRFAKEVSGVMEHYIILIKSQRDNVL